MTTIVNTPASTESGNNMGIIIGIIVLVIMGYLFFAYGLPEIQKVQLGTPQVTIPAKIDVTVNQPK